MFVYVGRVFLVSVGVFFSDSFVCLLGVFSLVWFSFRVFWGGRGGGGEREERGAAEKG